MEAPEGLPQRGTVETLGRKHNSAAKRTGWEEEANKMKRWSLSSSLPWSCPHIQPHPTLTVSTGYLPSRSITFSASCSCPEWSARAKLACKKERWLPRTWICVGCPRD